MIDGSNIEDGQVFQPYPDNDNELIRFNSGRWERSTNAGKNYSYNKDMQEKNKADALAPDSIRTVDLISEILYWEKDEAKEAEFQAYLEDQKRPQWERTTFNVRNPMSMIAANEGVLDYDIENALKSIVDKKTSEKDWLLSTIRSLMHDHCNDDPEFNVAAFIEDIKDRVTNKANELGNTFPAFQSKFKYGAADNLKNRITELLNEFKPANQDNPKAKKSKRINTEARDKHDAVLKKYDKYIKDKYSKTSAIEALVHDFKHEYGKGVREHTKKTIQSIIRKNRPE